PATCSAYSWNDRAAMRLDASEKTRESIRDLLSSTSPLHNRRKVFLCTSYSSKSSLAKRACRRPVKHTAQTAPGPPRLEHQAKFHRVAQSLRTSRAFLTSAGHPHAAWESGLS